jgi:hypothetical protein
MWKILLLFIQTDPSFPANFPLFILPKYWCQATPPIYLHGSASVLYKSLYQPLFFSNILDLILFGSNKGLSLMLTLPSFPHYVCHSFLCSTVSRNWNVLHKLPHHQLPLQKDFLPFWFQVNERERERERKKERKKERERERCQRRPSDRLRPICLPINFATCLKKASVHTLADQPVNADFVTPRLAEAFCRLQAGWPDEFVKESPKM